jgi:hypothetical protein
MKLGDLLETIFKYTGIKWLVKKVTEAVGIEDCGCESRKQALNKIKIDRKYGSTRPTEVGKVQRKKEK